jgi:hypothetical protein
MQHSSAGSTRPWRAIAKSLAYDRLAQAPPYRLSLDNLSLDPIT